MILVTGGSGVLGRALVAHLRSLDMPVHVVGSRDVDLRDAEATLGLFQELRPHLVYHLAAKVHGLGGNSRFPADMFVDNVRINTNVIDAAHRAGCSKIVAVSTVAVYASGLPMPTDAAAIWSGPPHGSEAAYGHAKRAMLAQLEAYASQFGFSFAYPLMTNIYGPHDRFDIEHGHVIPSLVAKFHRAKVEGSPVSVWGSGRAERDFLFASDAARALVQIAEKHQGVINVATGDVVPIRAAVEELSRASGVTDVRWDADKPDGQLLRRYDIGPLYSLGFRPTVDLRNGIKETYRWYSENFPNVRT